jgi:hypothetical protein
MSWLEHIRQQPLEKKVRVIWIVLGIVAVLLLVAWVLLTKARQTTTKDSTVLFETLSRGFQNVKENIKLKPQQ